MSEYYGQQPYFPPTQPKKNDTGKLVAFGCLGAMVVTVLFAGCVAVVASSDGSEPAESAPAPPVTGLTDKEKDARFLKRVEVPVGTRKDVISLAKDLCDGVDAGKDVGEMRKILKENDIFEGTAGTDNFMEASSFAYCPENMEYMKVPAKPTIKPKVKTYGDGDYQVGIDIQPGTYVSTGAQKGFFELCSASTEPTDGSFGEWETANADEQVILTVTKDSGVVSISGCDPFVLRK